MMICAVEEEIYLYDYLLLLRNLRNSSAKTEALKKLCEFCDFFFIFLEQTSKKVYFYEKETPAQVFSREFSKMF